MPEIQTIFRLGRRPGEGVFCDAEGLLVGEVALLERAPNLGDAQPWRPRPIAELNRDLSRCYGLPIEIEPKARGLETVAQALGRGDLAHAQMTALHLRFPEPPDLEKSAGDVQALIDLARRLDASGLLKRDWESNLHPRWPMGSQDDVGGQFAPAGSQGGGGATSGPTGAGAARDRRASPKTNAPRTKQRLAETTAPARQPPSTPMDNHTPGASTARPDIAPAGGDWGGAHLNDGVYYENGPNVAHLDNIHINSLGTIRRNIVEGALQNVNSIKWSDDVWNRNFRSGSNKCNLFVYDMLAAAGASPGLLNGTLHIDPPLPKQWADPAYHISGWVALSANEKPQPGDVVAQRISYRDADGHVMIVGPYQNGKLTFIGTGPRHGRYPLGTIEFIPAKTNLGPPDVPAGPLVFRRYVGHE